LDHGVPVDIIYLDFKKAFDSVPLRRILTKLKAYGIRGQILDWIEDFATDRRQRVKGTLAQNLTTCFFGPITHLIF